MAITMTELAKRLNLSQSTVSLVLNNRDKGRVRPELAERIRQEFDMSKNAFKRAVGRLLKAGKIKITEKNIEILNR